MARVAPLPHMREDQKILKDYWDLMKPRVMSLVLFTAFCGMTVAPSSQKNSLNIIALLLIALGAGGSAVLNMWQERFSDAQMHRTKNRPLPQGKIDSNEALIFGLMLSGASVFLMALLIGYLPAFLLGLTIYFYAYFYTTLLKPYSPQNIIWGGIAGALPPLIGWFCITTSFSWFPLYLFGLIFLWTIPHFWALSLHLLDDYSAARLPMLPIVKGITYTKKKIFIYTLITSLFAASPYIIQQKISFSLGLICLLGGRFIHLAYQVKDMQKSPLQLFKYSILYLFLLLILSTLDVKIGFLTL